MTTLPGTLAGWPLAASMAVAIAIQGVRAARRRNALNRALHEVRRPLQAITLAARPGSGRALGIDSCVELATAALEELDREINGGSMERAREAVPVRPLLESAVRRWKARASLLGGSILLRWRAGWAVVEGDPSGLAQALDNLIVNAMEHGGPSIVVEARLRGSRLRLSVSDSGGRPLQEPRGAASDAAISRLSGGRRHGHGIAVVTRFAAAHGGRFALRRSGSGSTAVLELPLAADGAELVA